MSRRIPILLSMLFTCALLLAGAGAAHASSRDGLAREKKPRMGLGQRCSKTARCKKGLACRMGDDGKVCRKRKGKAKAPGKAKAVGTAKAKGKKARVQAKKRRRPGKKRRGAARVIEKVEGGLDSASETIEGIEGIGDSVRSLGSQLKRLLDATQTGSGR